jgi:hypothetical protein
MMMRRLVAALMLTGIAAGGMWACGSDSTGPNSIAGTYNLVSVDGDSLPITAYFSDGPAGTIDVAELVSGYMRLNANGTYLRSHTYRTTRYTIDGHAIDEVTRLVDPFRVGHHLCSWCNGSDLQWLREREHAHYRQLRIPEVGQRRPSARPCAGRCCFRAPRRRLAHAV